jgi:NAD-dependent oxidoreductase involved in siderophore biosynthesis
MHNPLASVPDLSDQCADRGRRRARRLKMKIFAIENDTNNITIHATMKAAEAVPDSERFSSEAVLTKLATNWPAARLVEIWNSLPGETPVKKFKDRATAVARIWKAIQTLDETVPPESTESNATQVPVDRSPGRRSSISTF